MGEAPVTDGTVYRRIPPWMLVTEEDGTRRPSSQAFTNDADGSPMSGYHDGLLTAAGLAAVSVLAGHDGFFVTALNVSFLQGEGQTIVRSLIDPPVHPCDVAHVHVEGPKNSKRRKRFCANAPWVAGLGP